MILLSDLNARFARLRIATPDRKPFTVGHRFARHPGQRSRRDAHRRGGPSPAPRRQRHLQPVARRAARHPLLGRRRGHLAAGHDAVRLPGDLAAREPGRPALGLARLSRHDGERRARRASRRRAPAPPTTSATCTCSTGTSTSTASSSRSPTASAGSASATCSVTLRNLDLDAARAYIDSLPFYGTLSGTVAGAGFLDAMDVTIDWAFADAQCAGAAGVAHRGRRGSRAPRATAGSPSRTSR